VSEAMHPDQSDLQIAVKIKSHFIISNFCYQNYCLPAVPYKLTEVNCCSCCCLQDDDQAFKNLKKALNEASGKKR